MNNNRAEWQREFYLTHDKYRMQRQGTDCYKVVKGLTRILQLPTIAKLTSDNESVIGDFRLNRGEYGLEPYDEYAIQRSTTGTTSLPLRTLPTWILTELFRLALSNSRSVV